MRADRRIAVALATALVVMAATANAADLRGTGDLGVVIERADGRVQVVDTTARTSLGTVEGLGDLSHASVVYSRDARYAYVFGRDGGLTKIDLLTQRIVKRVIQAGNAIGGAISQDGRVVAAQQLRAGRRQAVRRRDARAARRDCRRARTTGKPSKVVGLVDAPGRRFVASLFDAGEIWLIDATDPRARRSSASATSASQPYDGLVTPDGRWDVAGLFGEDGIARRRPLAPGCAACSASCRGYGTREEPLPVYKMPHLRGGAIAGG